MAGNSIGEIFRVTTFGESHGKALGAVVDGCPPGIPLSEEDIQQDLDRRKPGMSSIASERKEKDTAEILSGVFQGRTTGHPIAVLIRNMDQDPSKYEAIKNIYRPGHADFTYQMKYGFRDYRGGGRASGRETVARVAAGTVARKILEKEGIRVIAYTIQVGKIKAGKIDYNERDNTVRCPDSAAAKRMVQQVLKLKKKGESIGGVIECQVQNCPVGLGEPVFDKLDADIAKAVISIGAVKAIEFGAGFAVAERVGSENNDELSIKEGGPCFLSNNSGGVLGGISSGQEIVFRAAIKPTPSVKIEQKTITTDKKEAFVKVEGRHDACICPRIVPVIEAMTCIILADHLLRCKANGA